jgi:hypothetical protein
MGAEEVAVGMHQQRQHQHRQQAELGMGPHQPQERIN